MRFTRAGPSLPPRVMSPSRRGRRGVGRAALNSVLTIPMVFTVGVGRTFSVLFTDEPRRGDDVRPSLLGGVQTFF